MREHSFAKVVPNFRYKDLESNYREKINFLKKKYGLLL